MWQLGACTDHHFTRDELTLEPCSRGKGEYAVCHDTQPACLEFRRASCIENRLRGLMS